MGRIPATGESQAAPKMCFFYCDDGTHKKGKNLKVISIGSKTYYVRLKTRKGDIYTRTSLGSSALCIGQTHS